MSAGIRRESWVDIPHFTMPALLHRRKLRGEEGGEAFGYNLRSHEDCDFDVPFLGSFREVGDDGITKERPVQ